MRCCVCLESQSAQWWAFGAQSLPTQSLTLLQGLAGGSLLHVVHAHTPKLSAQPSTNQWLRLGMVLGAVGLALIFTLHTHEHDAPPLSWLGMSAIIMLMVFIRPNLQHAVSLTKQQACN